MRHEAADDRGGDDRHQTDPPPQRHATRLRVRITGRKNQGGRTDEGIAAERRPPGGEPPRRPLARCFRADPPHGARQAPSGPCRRDPLEGRRHPAVPHGVPGHESGDEQAGRPQNAMISAISSVWGPHRAQGQRSRSVQRMSGFLPHLPCLRRRWRRSRPSGGPRRHRSDPDPTPCGPTPPPVAAARDTPRARSQ